MTHNPPATSGATGTIERVLQQQQTGDSPFSFERVPQLGQNVLYRPKGHNQGRTFTAYIYAVLSIRGQENAQETRASLRYLDAAGQAIDVVSVPLGMDGGCFFWNTDLEREAARITAMWLRHWGAQGIPDLLGSVIDQQQAASSASGGPGGAGMNG